MEMELLFKGAAIAVVGAVLALVLKKSAPETALLLSVALGCLLLYMACSALESVLDFVRGLTELAGVSSAAVSAVLKTAAIAVTTKFAGETCKDAGQGAAASALELVGCAAAVYVALPLLETVLETVQGLL